MSGETNFEVLYANLKLSVDTLRKLIELFRKNPNRKQNKEYFDIKRQKIKEERQKFGNNLKLIITKIKLSNELPQVLQETKVM
jgi:tagatose-1,6-bisphosphate aldolase